MKKSKDIALPENVEQENTNESNEFVIRAHFNDEDHTVRSESLDEALLSLRPTILKTHLKLHVEKDGKVCDKILPCFEARQIFRNTMSRKVFINRLILK